MKVVKAAAVRLSPVPHDWIGTVEKVVRKIRELGERGVQFATFPDMFVPLCPHSPFIRSSCQTHAMSLLSPTIEAISKACRQAQVIVSIGVHERDGGALYDTQLLMNERGSLIQRRWKSAPGCHERQVWARYALVTHGDQIESAMFRGSVCEASVRQHALTSGCFVVCASSLRDPEQVSGGCFTAIVAPDGTLLGEPIRAGEGEVVAELDFNRITNPCLASLGDQARQVSGRIVSKHALLPRRAPELIGQKRRSST